MSVEKVIFADATEDLEGSRYAILGVPFDRTSTHRRGTSRAPLEIRKESYNFEAYLPDHDVHLDFAKIADIGDVHDMRDFSTLKTSINYRLLKVKLEKAFPIILGGEHSITPFVIEALGMGDIALVSIDAHLDYREDYEGEKNSHACAVKRATGIIGVKNAVVVGVRSICFDEKEAAKKDGLKWVTSDEVREKGIDNTAKEILEYLKGKKIYLSLDMDGIDPAYAPGVSTPEPFGLSTWNVRALIKALAPRLVGFDVVEVCPPYDNGNTASLAAKFVRDVVGNLESLRKY